ncbi:MAG: MauE/DoxX family redox-associated membrane protein [Ignavibacteriaceae bacterium]
MKSLINNKYLLFLFRIVLAMIFIYAGMEKISDTNGFSISINNYKILPLFLVNIFAITLPWLELTTGILLLFGIKVKENSFIISVLLIIFIIAISISLIRGLNIDCGCFGTVSGTKIGVNKIIEDLVLLLLGVILIKFDSEFLSLVKKSKH